jgi:hypothetical protein
VNSMRLRTFYSPGLELLSGWSSGCSSTSMSRSPINVVRYNSSIIVRHLVVKFLKPAVVGQNVIHAEPVYLPISFDVTRYQQ